MAEYNVWLSTSDRGSGYQDCGTCGATVPWKNIHQHEAFHATFTNRRDQGVSKVSWCDKGNHAFRAGSPGSITMEGTQNDENGIPQTISMDICAEHNPYAPENLKDEAQRLRLTSEAESELRG